LITIHTNDGFPLLTLNKNFIYPFFQHKLIKNIIYMTYYSRTKLLLIEFVGDTTIEFDCLKNIEKCRKEKDSLYIYYNY
jgi:hypothetical protein